MPGTKRALLRLVALLAMFTMLAAACDGGDEDVDVGGDTTTTTGEDGDGQGQVGASVDGTLKFGALLPQTGDLAQFGPGMLAGVELAISDINDAGGVLGKDVELVTADSATDKDQANTQAERLINAENVDAVLGAAASSVTLEGVIAPVTSAGRLQCSGSTTGPGLSTFDDNGLFFRTAPSDAFQAQLLGDTIAADGHSEVAILYRQDRYGEPFADFVEQEVEAAGGNVVANVGYDPKAPNFDAEAGRIANANPEALVVIAFPDEGAKVLEALITENVGPDDVAHYYTDGLASDDFPESVDPNNPQVLDGAKGTRPGAAEEPTEFNNRLTSEKNVDTVTFAANFYDCAVLFALGAVVAETDDPQQIAKELVELSKDGTKCTSFKQCKDLLDDGEDIDFDGITGFDLDSNGEPDEGFYELWEFKDGDISSIRTGIIIRTKE